MKSLSNHPIKSIRNIFVSLILCFCVLAVKPLKAQETGPLLMKQQLGYTLAGGVAGVGIGALVWFMDPLNPNIQPIDQAKDGLYTELHLEPFLDFTY